MPLRDFEQSDEGLNLILLTLNILDKFAFPWPAKWRKTYKLSESVLLYIPSLLGTGSERSNKVWNIHYDINIRQPQAVCREDLAAPETFAFSAFPVMMQIEKN